MGELERQRQARDLWISRGHVVAYLTGTVLLGLFMFGIGYRMGGEARGERSRPYETSLVSGAPDQELVQVLDRVDAMKDPLGHQQMTFPELRDPGDGDVLGSRMDADADEGRAAAFRLNGDEDAAWPEEAPFTQPHGWGVVLQESNEPKAIETLQGRVDASGSLATEIGWGVVDGQRVFWLMRQGFTSSEEAGTWLEQHRDELSSAGVSDPSVREFSR